MTYVCSHLDVKGSLPYEVDQKTGSRPRPPGCYVIYVASRLILMVPSGKDQRFFPEPLSSLPHFMRLE